MESKGGGFKRKSKPIEFCRSNEKPYENNESKNSWYYGSNFTADIGQISKGIINYKTKCEISKIEHCNIHTSTIHRRVHWFYQRIQYYLCL